MTPRSFKPQRSQAVTFGVPYGMFGGAAIFSAAMPFLDVDRRHPGLVWFVAISGLLLFGGLTGVTAWTHLRTRGTFTVDDEGIARDNGTITRVAWADIQSVDYERAKSAGGSIRTKDDRTLYVPFQMLQQGSELRQIVEARTANRPADAARLAIDRDFRLRERKLLTAITIFGLLFFLVLGVAGMAAAQRKGIDPWLQLGPLALMVMCLGLVAVHGATRTVRLEPHAIVDRGAIGRRELPFDEIHTIQLDTSRSRQGVFERMEIHGSRGKLLLGSTIEDFATLRDAILARCPQARIVDQRERA